VIGGEGDSGRILVSRSGHLLPVIRLICWASSASESVAASASVAQGADKASAGQLGEIPLGGVVGNVEKALVVGACQEGADGEKAEELGLAGREAARKADVHATEGRGGWHRTPTGIIFWACSAGGFAYPCDGRALQVVLKHVAVPTCLATLDIGLARPVILALEIWPTSLQKPGGIGR